MKSWEPERRRKGRAGLIDDDDDEKDEGVTGREAVARRWLVDETGVIEPLPLLLMLAPVGPDADEWSEIEGDVDMDAAADVGVDTDDDEAGR